MYTPVNPVRDNLLTIERRAGPTLAMLLRGGIRIEP